MKTIAKSIGLILLNSLIIYTLNTRIKVLPALGGFFSPLSGFWKNEESDYSVKQKVDDLKGIKEGVTVKVDDNNVPHIFAKNEYDLYFMQGFLTAKDRLWQMEFQTYAADGRVSEVLGSYSIELDQYRRRMGIAYGAEKSLRQLMTDPQIKTVLQAYTAGVNAYIKQLKPQDYPFEYKLFGYSPEAWSPYKCALLMKEMAFMLASKTEDLRMTNIKSIYGEQIAENLFPNYPSKESPIIPVGTKLDFEPIVIKKPESSVLNDVVAHAQVERASGLGSNNWALSGSKTLSGMPILANDPHLRLTLPSVWYQMQLSAPGVNVCGVSLPGVPNIVIGFNQKVAWGVTNVSADVTDWYKITFKDNLKNEYWYEGQWRPIKRRIEQIKVKGGRSITDTVLYTHHGPIVYLDSQKPFSQGVPVGYALRWIGHEGSEDLTCFYRMNRAKNYEDYVSALAYYQSPAQNFIFASNTNDISIWVNGKFPKKWNSQGKYLLDGSRKESEWDGFLPHAHNPHVKNPERGYVSSANQSPTDKDYPYYINWQFSSSERAMRINQCLDQMKGANADSMIHLQNDNFNLRAAELMPKLISFLDVKKLNAVQQKALNELLHWNHLNTAEQVAPTIFDEWVKRIMFEVWDDNFTSTDKVPMMYPTIDRTFQMINMSDGADWVDNKKTPKKENIKDIINHAFVASTDTLMKYKGNVHKNWQWGWHKSTDIRFFIPFIKGLGRDDIFMGGGDGIVNATTESTGPSWKMVVELGETPKAYGILPGGQSGNPGSKYYDNMIDTWKDGKLKRLVFLKNRSDQNPNVVSTLEFNSIK
jgi:penicillin G amidase